ncbi:MAG: alpha/beta fold hydrolase [Oceanicaulis sp.]
MKQFAETSGAAVVTVKVGPAPHIALDVAGSGPLAVFLHGIGGNRTNWRDQLPVFAKRFTAVAWDARGYGESDDYSGALKFEDFSADLERVLDHFGVADAHVIGLSMGGRIALDFTGRRPGRVRSLTLVDTGAGRKPGDPAELERFLALRKKPILDGRSPAEIAEGVAQTLAGDSITPDAYQRLVESLSRLHPESYLKTMDTVTRYDGYPAFETIERPTLVVVGDEDRIAPPDWARRMADSIPGAALKVIERAGHISNIEAPEAFNAAVLEFLERVEAGSSNAA